MTRLTVLQYLLMLTADIVENFMTRLKHIIIWVFQLIMQHSQDQALEQKPSQKWLELGAQQIQKNQ